MHIPRLVGLSLLILLGSLGQGWPAAAGTGRPQQTTLLTCEGWTATIVGTKGNDKIVGTPGKDVIVALGGRDMVRGRGGNDVICGNFGADILEGGPGDDRIFGGRDAAYYDTDCGEFTPIGDVGPPYVTGDVLVPGPGDDYLDAGDDPRQQTASCGNPDQVTFRREPRGVRGRLGDPGEAGVIRGADRDVLVGQWALAVVGSRYGDHLFGGSGREELYGNGGTDFLSGGAGDDALADTDYRTEDVAPSGDRLVGGTGHDALTSWRGEDSLDGGPDDDKVTTTFGCGLALGGDGHDELSVYQTYLPDGTTSVALDAGAGTVSALPSRPPCGNILGFETYLASAALVPLDFTGTEDAEKLVAYGQSGVTTHLLGGDDVITGTAADDVIDAGDGIDQVDADLGQDVCIDAENTSGCEALRTASGVAAGEPVVLVALDGQDLYFSPNGDGTYDRARFEFSLSKRSAVRILVRDDRQRLVRSVRLGSLNAGRHVWRWDGQSSTGKVLPDGEYEVSVRAWSGEHSAQAGWGTQIVQVPDPGRAVLTRPVVYPSATSVADRLAIVLHPCALRHRRSRVPGVVLGGDRADPTAHPPRDHGSGRRAGPRRPPPGIPPYLPLVGARRGGQTLAAGHLPSPVDREGPCGQRAHHPPIGRGVVGPVGRAGVDLHDVGRRHEPR